MRAPWWVLLIIAWVCLLIADRAMAHDWYSSTSDPVTTANCCGGDDCAPVDPAWVTSVPEGYRLRMSVAEARTVNPNASAPIDAVIPWSRVQAPPNADHEFYACIRPSVRVPPEDGVICFFSTPTM